MTAQIDPRPVAPALNDDHRRDCRQSANGIVEFTATGHAANLIFIGKENIDQRKDFPERRAPAIFWIIVSVERESESLLFDAAQKLREAGMEAFLQVEGREVEVASLRKEVEVEISDAKFGDRSGIRENVASVTVWQQ